MHFIPSIFILVISSAFLLMAEMKDEAISEEGQQRIETFKTIGETQKRRVAFDLVLPKQTLAPLSKLIFVTRTGGNDNTMDYMIRHLFNVLRLQKVNTGVLVKATEKLVSILRRTRSVVHYGFLPFESVKTIIYDLATVKLGNKITQLNTDNVVEQRFGKYNINCIEDVVNEIANVGPHFKDVLTAILPISVPDVGKKPSKGKKGKKSSDGGGTEDHIIQLVGKMKIA